VGEEFVVGNWKHSATLPADQYFALTVAVVNYP
jgi:hypothetical protein